MAVSANLAFGTSTAVPSFGAGNALRPSFANDTVDDAFTRLTLGADADPAGQSALRASIEAGLNPVQRGELARLFDTAGGGPDLNFGQRANAVQIAGPVSAVGGALSKVPPNTVKVLQNLAQLSLDLVGIVDPTPTSDLLSAAISAATGDWRGFLVSAASAAVPYAGDALKATRVGKWLKTVSETLELAATNPAFKRAVSPALTTISDLIGKLPINRVSGELDVALKSVKRQIDDVLGVGTKLAGKVATLSRRVGLNEATWKFGADGRPIEVVATIRQVFKGGVRSAAEDTASKLAGKAGKAGDQGGHILGYRFFKEQGPKNLFPQSGAFNNSAYKKLENEIAEFAKAGAEVKVSVKLLGGGARNAGRPSRLQVVYSATDPNTGKVLHKVARSFDNDASAVYNRLSTAQIKALLAK
ncbi:MAG: DNA/RNA non-specific endonuclease [Sphingomonas sp.]